MQIGIAMRASVLQCGQNWDVPGTAGTALNVQVHKRKVMLISAFAPNLVELFPCRPGRSVGPRSLQVTRRFNSVVLEEW